MNRSSIGLLLIILAALYFAYAKPPRPKMMPEPIMLEGNASFNPVPESMVDLASSINVGSDWKVVGYSGDCVVFQKTDEDWVRHMFIPAPGVVEEFKREGTVR